jgi:general stress protein 26
MSEMTMSDISAAMRKIDICMMTTRCPDGALESRPMSNNKDVDYDGDSYFFAMRDASVVQDLQRNPQTSLAYEGKHHLYISISGKGEIITDKETMQEHWVKDLDAWFDEGIDTPGLTLIHVRADSLKYWDKMTEGEISIRH